MSASRFMTTVLCDDVRREEGHKLSYLGIYSESLLLNDFPARLPKLCFVMSVHLPAEDPLPRSVSFRLLKDGEVLAQTAIDPESLAVDRPERAGEDGTARRVIRSVLQIFPIEFTEPCTLRARAIVDGEELKGGSWTVARLT